MMRKLKRPEPIETTELCKYGCGRVAKYKTSGGHLICESSPNKCPINSKKNSSTNKGYKSQSWYDAMSRRKGNSTNQYTKAKELGLPKPKMSEETKKKLSVAATGKNHTEESKRKISAARLKYLHENPDKVPYLLNHSSRGESYPERYFREVFEKNGIEFEQEHRIGLYSLDFLIGKYDVEVDGEQHYSDSKIVDNDVRRGSYLKENGLETIRIRWREYKKLSKEGKVEFIDNLMSRLIS